MDSYAQLTSLKNKRIFKEKPFNSPVLNTSINRFKRNIKSPLYKDKNQVSMQKNDELNSWINDCKFVLVLLDL